MLKCKTCEKNINGSHFNKKYCSWSCNPASFNQKFKVINCLKCGKEIENPHPRTKFCSKECYPWNQHGFRSEGMRLKYAERKNDPEWKAKQLKGERRRDRKLKEFLRDFKTKTGCADCNFSSHHAALQFDHVRGEKTIEVCKTKSIKRALEEIEKCEVVCANCHQIRTFKRLQEKGKTI